MARILTVTSGKGGVGKTSISLNLSLALASQGFKVCLFDADLGLANVNILTGIFPEKDLEGVISGLFSLNEIIIKDYQGIDIIPGSSGVQKIADLSRTQTGTLISAFLDLEDYDYFIFDTSAGISSQVLSFCMASHEIILVATCEPTSLTDAYSMLKVLSKHGYRQPIRVVINQVTSGSAAKKAYAQLKNTVKRFLSVRVAPLGIVASDKNVRSAVVSQTPFTKMFPDSIASRCINNICDKLIDRAGSTGDMPLELFWDKCLSFLEKTRVPEKEEAKEILAAETPPPVTMDSELKKTLEKIESRISELTQEVVQVKEQIKKLAEDQASGKQTVKVEEPPEPVEPAEIFLDFESWMKKHQSR